MDLWVSLLAVHSTEMLNGTGPKRGHTGDSMTFCALCFLHIFSV